MFCVVTYKRDSNFFICFFQLTEFSDRLLIYLNDIIPTLEELLTETLDENAYIQWSDGGLPIIKSTLTAIVNNYGDVDCVAFDKFIFNPSQRYIIEILFSGRITVGVLNE